MHNPNQWPQWYDFNDLSLNDAAAFLNQFSAIHEPECIRVPGNFKYIAFKDPFSCGMFDICEALRFVIDTINANPDDGRLAALGKRLRGYLGPLKKRIALTLVGNARHNYVIEPTAWLHEVNRIEMAQAEVDAIVNAYGKARSLESMCSLTQMRHLTVNDIMTFAPAMQKYALTYIINAVNDTRGDSAMRKLAQRLKRKLGNLYAPIPLSLQGYKTLIQPHGWVTGH
jgi:hypothetical protein